MTVFVGVVVEVRFLSTLDAAMEASAGALIPPPLLTAMLCLFVVGLRDGNGRCPSTLLSATLSFSP